MNNTLINIPDTVALLINTLLLNGHAAYIVGGCVRDSLLGKNPSDWDICTSAKPEETKRIFQGFNIVETGIKHGTLTIIINNQPYEVTTFRTEGRYSDKRRPDEVRFIPDIKGDLSRRDFTINAMAYNPADGIINCWGAKNDLDEKILRTVGNADERFAEDPLRILRALRFLSTLCFEIEKETAESVHKNRLGLKNISRERINPELCALLLGEGVSHVLSEFHDVICVFIPELKNMKKPGSSGQDTWEHTVRAVSLSQNDIFVRLALLFCDVAKPCVRTESENPTSYAAASAEIAGTLMRRLRFDKKTTQSVCALIRHRDAPLKPDEKCVKEWLNHLGVNNFKRLIELKRGETLAVGGEDSEKLLRELHGIELCLKGVFDKKDCYRLKDLAVNGEDILSLGIPPGREIGEILQKLLDLAINDPAKNKKNTLLETAMDIHKDTNKIQLL